MNFLAVVVVVVVVAAAVMVLSCAIDLGHYRDIGF